MDDARRKPPVDAVGWGLAAFLASVAITLAIGWGLEHSPWVVALGVGFGFFVVLVAIVRARDAAITATASSKRG